MHTYAHTISFKEVLHLIQNIVETYVLVFFQTFKYPGGYFQIFAMSPRILYFLSTKVISNYLYIKSNYHWHIWHRKVELILLLFARICPILFLLAVYDVRNQTNCSLSLEIRTMPGTNSTVPLLITIVLDTFFIFDKKKMCIQPCAQGIIWLNFKSHIFKQRNEKSNL